MKEKSVKTQKTESLLKELIPEALASFEDSRISSLNITRVDCSRGKYDADVYFYEPYLDEKDAKEVIQHLTKVSNKLTAFTLASTGWYRSPKFHFKYDKSVEEMNRLEELFARIKSE